MFRLLVAGGGTGGHLFPGIAVAEEFLRRDRSAQVLFVGTGRPVESEILGKRGLPTRTITAAGFKGKGLLGRLRSLFSLPVGLWQSLKIISGFKPDMVLGVGGYVSGPVGVAARLLGRPTAIHEQNSVPGLANRLLGRLVDLVFISFESSAPLFPKDKTRLTGNPIRREIAAVKRPAARTEPTCTLLVVGGSLGARAINQAMVEAMPLLAESGLSLKLIHQTGQADYQTVKNAYAGLNLVADVRPFIDDMDRAYLAADLVVCRAGALTVSELAAVGLPAVFIPLPTAANNHQEFNARSLVDLGAAEMILQKDLTPKLLAQTISRLAQNRELLATMEQKAAQAARPDAAGRICDICLEFTESRRKGQGR
jgi:UDP-N-acetylglucosamine--N-acetylmuramyl-(pentapeptide) pyrophosphoryl-undecaprenol N-acetylglucosamine transferase